MQINPKDLWPDSPVAAVRPNSGAWRVVFARAKDGTYPAAEELIALLSEEAKGKEDLIITRARSFTGLLSHFAMAGPGGMQRRMYKSFKGEDAKFAMCEFIRKSDQGVRVLGFQRPNRTMVLACAFRKPPQPQTPPSEKRRAVKILKEHEAQIKKDSADAGRSPRGGGRRRRRR